jgi:hypothetical protein
MRLIVFNPFCKTGRLATERLFSLILLSTIALMSFTLVFRKAGSPSGIGISGAAEFGAMGIGAILRAAGGGSVIV